MRRLLLLALLVIVAAPGCDAAAPQQHAQVLARRNATSTVLPSGLAAWFANDWGGTDIPEALGTGPGTMNDSGGAVVLTYVPADGAWVYFPAGLTTSSITTPYDASFNITGDNEIQAKAWATDWTPTTAKYVFLRGTATGTSQWYFRNNSSTAGTLLVAKTNSGTTRTSDDPVGFSNGAPGWIRVRVDVGTDVTFDTSTDGSSWSDLGGVETDIAAATTEATYGLVLGAAASAGTGQFEGGLYQLLWYPNVTNSSPVVTFNAANFTAPYATCLDSVGHTYTINRPSSGLQPFVVDRSMLVGDGSNDLFIIADHNQLDLGTGSASVSMLIRVHNVSASRALIANKTGTGQGWALNISGTGITANASDGTDNVTTGSSTITQGTEATLVTWIRDGNTLHVALDGVRDAGTDISAVGSVTNANALHVLAYNSAGSYADGVAVMGLALHGSALTPAQCVILKAEMIAANQ